MKRIISFALLILLVLVSVVPTYAKDTDKTDAVIDVTGKKLYETVKEPCVGTIGGEWVILGLARSDIDIPKEYFESYYRAVEDSVKSKKGVLHQRKYTEYSRVVITLTALGKDPENVAGYDLLAPLADYEKTVFQGINGAVWALIAFDCGNYAIPQNTTAKIQATREKYVTYILERQLSDGGWALTGSISDPDVTAMVLTALSRYQNDAKVKNATDKGLSCLSKMQNATGGFSADGLENAESCAQVIVALCELGIPIDDTRFIKYGNTVSDALLLYYDGKGGFCHEKNGETNQMATEQGFYALVALKRFDEKKSSLFKMDDINAFGLSGKHKDVQKMPVIAKEKTFDDIGSSIYKKEIEALASRGIINGKTDKAFDPESNMTRAEFATIIARGLGLPQKSSNVFKDVTKNDWFYNYVGTAYSYGIIKGVSESKFHPNGTITREEAACMVARAAKLCGHDTELDTDDVRNILSDFSDNAKTSVWAKGSLAFCYSKGILDGNAQKIDPKEHVTREEIASMLYNVLNISDLL